MLSKGTFSPGVLLRIGLLFAILLLIAGIRIFGLDAYLHVSQLHTVMEHLQTIPPIMFVGGMALVAVFCLPIFPLVMIAGVLFGTWWGLVYSLAGASIGASASFLLSRYLAGDWIERRLSGHKAERIRQLVFGHGWKVVLVLRLLPVFPFALLNYCLGLTGIRFTHYLGATFIGIAPACTACVVFSDSLGEILTDGAVVPAVFGAVIALLLLVGLSVIGKKTVFTRIYQDMGRWEFDE